MAHPQYTPEQAIKLHRDCLQQVVAEIMAVVGDRPAGVGRLCDGLQCYWEGWYQRRQLRRGVVAATLGTAYEHSVEPMGRPFLVMIRAELAQAGKGDVEPLAQWIYIESRAIADAEARSGRRSPRRREKLLARIRA